MVFYLSLFFQPSLATSPPKEISSLAFSLYFGKAAKLPPEQPLRTWCDLQTAPEVSNLGHGGLTMRM